MYGECDERFFPTIMRLADRWNGKIPRIAEGGKKQLSYVGESVSLLDNLARTEKKEENFWSYFRIDFYDRRWETIPRSGRSAWIM